MLPEALALVGSPQEWAVVGIVLVVIFAPRLLPGMVRIASKRIGREVRGRLGLPMDRPEGARRESGTGPTPPPGPATLPVVEVLPPEHPAPTLRATDSRPLAPPQPPEAAKPLWPAVVLVTGVVAVLLWFLLHSR